MEPILILGIILFTGIVTGEITSRIGLPKVTGYILAGLILNPGLTDIIPASFVNHTGIVTNVALSFITFSVGGTLLFPKLKTLGKSIILITLFEAECAFIFVAASFIILSSFIFPVGTDILTFTIPFSLLIASLASPTDPSATLAVKHEYKAKGEVTSTIMGVAAFDDVLGIINYSIALSFAGILIHSQPMGFSSITEPFLKITGSVAAGIVFGIFLNLMTGFLTKGTEGVLIALIIGMLSLCYGVAGMFELDQLLSTMTMGVIAVNYNKQSEKIFKILERYTEELIFVLFFTLSAMHLDLSVLISNYILIIIFVLSRGIGKMTGTLTGAKIAKSSPAVKKFTVGGLIPQGGIVIGLALIIKQNPAFSSVSDIILNVIIGATIIHEISGPVISKIALEKAGEIGPEKKD